MPGINNPQEAAPLFANRLDDIVDSLVPSTYTPQFVRENHLDRITFDLGSRKAARKTRETVHRAANSLFRFMAGLEFPPTETVAILLEFDHPALSVFDENLKRSLLDRTAELEKSLLGTRIYKAETSGYFPDSVTAERPESIEEMQERIAHLTTIQTRLREPASLTTPAERR